MPGPDHGRKLALAHFRIRHSGTENTESFAPRVALGSSSRFFFVRQHIHNKIVGNSGIFERSADSSFPVTPTHKRCRPAFGKCAIINIAKSDKARRNCIDVGLRIALPASFTKLALQVSGKLGLCCCVATHIVKREGVKPRGIKGFAYPR